MTAHTPSPSTTSLIERYEAALLGVFGRPQLVLEHGDGAWVWDVDGRRFLDLMGGIAVNALGHGHPALVSAISKQAGEQLHVSNFFTTTNQIALAERLIALGGAPDGSRVFLSNSGTEAIEAVIKLARRTGRGEIIAFAGGFHGRSTGALALTHKAAYREPFEPLLPGVRHVPYGDIDALRAALRPTTAAVVLEPIQGEAGVIEPPAGYLAAVRELTSRVGALMVVDEIQTGVGRTGRWFAHQAESVQPDVMTLAKGLAGGVPIGATITYGPQVSALLGPSQHGSTFGGNPLAATAALAVLDTIETSGLLTHATETGERLAARVMELRHPMIRQVRGRGLLRAIGLREPIAQALAAAALRAGFIVNPVLPDAIRLAPPLIIGADELDLFIDALPELIATATEGDLAS
ncbi:MAG: acetylornithine transaminase [Nostocoides sp.]